MVLVFASVRSVVEKDAEEGARLIGGERVDGKKADATASGEIDSAGSDAVGDESTLDRG